MSNNVVILPFVGAYVDHSGTIAVNATSQVLAAAASQRHSIIFQNLSAGSLYLNFTTAASAGSGSLQVVSGGTLFLESSSLSGEAINVYGALAGQAFTCKIN